MRTILVSELPSMCHTSRDILAPLRDCGLNGDSVVKNLPAMKEMWVPSLSWEGPLEKEVTIHSNILVWKIQLTEEPGGL